MGSRGRKSAAQLMAASGVETMRRPAPPDANTLLIIDPDTWEIVDIIEI